MLEAQSWGILIPEPIQEGSEGVSNHHQTQAPHSEYSDPICISTRMQSRPDSSFSHAQWLSHSQW